MWLCHICLYAGRECSLYLPVQYIGKWSCYFWDFKLKTLTIMDPSFMKPTNHEQTRFCAPKVPGQPVKRRYNAASDPSPLFLPFDPFPSPSGSVHARLQRSRPRPSSLPPPPGTAARVAGEEGRAALR